MTDEEFDDALDGLSLNKRNKILRLVGDEERAPPPKRRTPFVQMVGRSFICILSILWSFPFTIVGLVLILTVVLAPIGVILLFIGAWPLFRLVQKWLRQSLEIDPE